MVSLPLAKSEIRRSREYLDCYDNFRVQYTAAVTVPWGSGFSHLHFLTLTAKMHILEIGKSSSAKTKFSFFRYFFVGFRFFRFFITDVGVGFGFLKYRDIGFGFRLPTRL